MSNRNYHYRNPDFNTVQTERYTLLVQLDLSSFSYAVIDQNKLLVLEQNVNIDELINPSDEHSLLFSKYQKSIVGLHQQGFTFVPFALFKSDLTVDFARFLYVKSTEKVLSQPLDQENQVIYKVEESVINLLTDKFYITNTVFGPKGWIKLMAASNPANHHLFIHINHDRVEILNFNEGKLRFYNSFEFKNADELAYFILLVSQELQLKPSDIILMLSGDVNGNNEYAGRLAKFFGKVDINHSKPVELPEEIESHTVLTLTALLLCGSSEEV